MGPMKLVTILISLTIISSSTALKVGPFRLGPKKQCSRRCQSNFCFVAPLLRYGKYCGVLYSGCPGEKPCDGIDACCMAHDNCIDAKKNDYLSSECSSKFLDCIRPYKHARRESTFKGNKCEVSEVVDVMGTVIRGALVAGRVLQRH